MKQIGALMSRDFTNNKKKKKMSTHISLRKLRRLTWVDTFCANALSPVFIECGSYIRPLSSAENMNHPSSERFLSDGLDSCS